MTVWVGVDIRIIYIHYVYHVMDRVTDCLTFHFHWFIHYCMNCLVHKCMIGFVGWWIHFNVQGTHEHMKHVVIQLKLNEKKIRIKLERNE